MTENWEQVKDVKGGETGQGTSVIGLHKKILVDDQQGREAQVSSGDWWMGEPSMWMVAPRPGKWGGRSRRKERMNQCQRVKDGGEIGVRSWGERTEIQNTVETGGEGGG